jgi:hypothetical protein
MKKNDAGSFKDPAGNVFYLSGSVFRQVNRIFRVEFDRFIDSKLYEDLVQNNLLIPHEDVTLSHILPENVYRIIKPERIPFISYPYEWSFSMLKDAALATLEIQECAFRHGMSLRDASAFNVQFLKGKPIFIDTLSFEPYAEGTPWIAYGQFCRHFLAPLALMALVDIRLAGLFKTHLDGIPLDLASRLLAGRTGARIGLMLHIHAHARSIASAETRTGLRSPGKFTKTAMLALIDSLKSTIGKLTWNPSKTEWADYYCITNYSAADFEEKKRLLLDYLKRCGQGPVIDLGANDGTFSRIASELGRETLSIDTDPTAVEKNYLKVKARSEKNNLPLLIDIMNPTPAIGWMNRERRSFMERVGRDSILVALALIHHIAIGQNVPLDSIARSLAEFGKELILEFVPKDDSQVSRMLAMRKDIFPAYTKEGYLEAFAPYYSLQEACRIGNTSRTLTRSLRDDHR